MSKLELEDKTLSCKDCNSNFTFTKEEQGFYLKRAYAEPKRCPPCRKARKKVRRRNRRSLIRSITPKGEDTSKEE